jgi:hypothetical protein
MPSLKLFIIGRPIEAKETPTGKEVPGMMANSEVLGNKVTIPATLEKIK